MAYKSNVFTADLDRFLEMLANHAHYQMIVNWQLRLAKDSSTRSLEYMAKRGQPNQYGAANGLSLLNIFHDGQRKIRSLYGMRVTWGEKLLPVVNEMERRFNSLIWVSVFETFEKYLKALYGKMLYQLRNEITIHNKKEFHGARKGVSKREGTAPYYQEYADYACRRDCELALCMFREELK